MERTVRRVAMVDRTLGFGVCRVAGWPPRHLDWVESMLAAGIDVIDVSIHDPLWLLQGGPGPQLLDRLALSAPIDTPAQAIERASRMGVTRLHWITGASDYHLMHVARLTRSRWFAQAKHAIRATRRTCTRVHLSIADACRVECQELIKIGRHLEDAGATGLTLSGTRPAEDLARLIPAMAGLRRETGLRLGYEWSAGSLRANAAAARALVAAGADQIETRPLATAFQSAAAAAEVMTALRRGGFQTTSQPGQLRPERFLEPAERRRGKSRTQIFARHLPHPDPLQSVAVDRAHDLGYDLSPAEYSNLLERVQQLRHGRRAVTGDEIVRVVHEVAEQCVGLF